MMMKRRNHGFNNQAQMTIELAYALPIFIILACVIAQCVLVITTCVAFDGSAHERARIEVVAPQSKTTLADQAARIENHLTEQFGSESISISTHITEMPLHHARVESQITFEPQFFGRALPDEIFGLRLPSFSHTASHVFSVYAKAGVA